MKDLFSSLMDLLEAPEQSPEDLQASRRLIRDLLSAYRPFGFDAFARGQEEAFAELERRISARRSRNAPP